MAKKAKNSENTAEIVEIVPAILSKTKEDLMQKISRVSEAAILQIDLMDGKFVNNKTIGLEELGELPRNKIIEYHLMVANPLEWVEKLPGGKNNIFEVHIESVDDEKVLAVKRLVEKKGSKLFWVVNPPTQISALEGKMDGVEGVLVMAVHPGKSGQSYIAEVERKMTALGAKYPGIVIEVDGGIDTKTAISAVKAGANRLAAASALFSKEDANKAYFELKKAAEDARK